MAFTIRLGFATEHAQEAFIERTLPKVRGQRVDLPTEETEEPTLHWIGVAVTSQTAARDLCHLLVSFLTHTKNTRVDVAWTALDGQVQRGEVTANAARDVEIVSVRLGAAAKAAIDHEKAAVQSDGPRN